MHSQKIALIGVGLLGGSLGMAIRLRKLAGRVAGYVRRPESVAECLALGAVDEATCDVAAAVREAQWVVLCTPLAQMAPLVQAMAPALRPGCVVTDVGSVKGSVVRELEPLVAAAGGVFVGSHPMAGAEKMGVRHAHPELFEGSVCVVTPTRRTPPEAVKRVKDFWRAVGAQTLRLSPDIHDELVSRSSHLPHVVACELANYVLSPAHAKEQALLCANGFRDTTRIASGSPEMWRDIVQANRVHLSRVLGVFVEDLQEFRHALEVGDERALNEFFENAKRRRDAWVGQGQSPE